MAAGRPGSTRAWRTVRAAVLLRDGYRCRVALPGTWQVRGGAVRRCAGTATEAHHVHGYTRCVGCRLDAMDHLVASCRACNLRVGDPGRVAAGVHVQRNARGRVVTKW